MGTLNATDIQRAKELKGFRKQQYLSNSFEIAVGLKGMYSSLCTPLLQGSKTLMFGAKRQAEAC